MSGSEQTRAGLAVAGKLGYALGAVAYSLPHQLIASLFIFFATAILKLSASVAGVLIALSSLWDAVSDPLMGYLSDNTESRRLGRRHPYLFVGTIALTALTYLFWSVHPAGSAARKVWLVLALLIASKSALTIYVVPYNALGAELSGNYDDRSSLQSYRAAFHMIGMVLAVVATNVIFFRSTPEYPLGQLNPAAYPRLGGTFSLVILMAGWLSYLATRPRVPHLPQRTPAMRRRAISVCSLVRDIKGALANRDLLALVMMILIIETGFQLGIAIGVHTYTYTYGISGPTIGALMLLLFGCSIGSQPLWAWLSARRDKKLALLLGMALGLGGFVGAPWTHVWWKTFPIDASSLPYTLGIFLALGGLGNGAFMSLPYSMLADTVDAQELRDGSRCEGLFYGLYTLAYKLGSSISLLAAGYVLSAIGYDASATSQSAATQYNLAMVPSYLLVLIAPPSVYALSRYSIDRKRHNSIRDQLAAGTKEQSIAQAKRD